jgi:2-polyprenyl-3-methyl-5-hydroxy-6-metoxy-1,4-benzoquinol methylase
MHDYKVKFENIRIADVDYKIRSLFDNQQFSDPKGESESLGISSAMWPIFGQVWPLAHILASIVAKESLVNKNTLEIGCGIALSSIVIKNLGGEITASDYHPLAKSFLEANAKLNCLAPIEFQTGNWNTKNPELGKFNNIIASDILYEPRHVLLASAFIEQHASPVVKVTVLDPSRGFHRLFSREMQNIGFTHTFEDLRDYPLNGNKRKGFILRFSRN